MPAASAVESPPSPRTRPRRHVHPSQRSRAPEPPPPPTVRDGDLVRDGGIGPLPPAPSPPPSPRGGGGSGRRTVGGGGGSGGKVAPSAASSSSSSSSSPCPAPPPPPPMPPTAGTGGGGGAGPAPFSLSKGALLSEIESCAEGMDRRSVRLDAVAASVTRGGGDLADGGGGGDCSTSPFLDLLDSELARLTELVSAQSSAIAASARSLLAGTGIALSRHRGGDSGDPRLAEEAARCRRGASELSSAVLGLGSFARESAVGLRSVARTADGRLGTSCLGGVDGALSRPPWSCAATGGEAVAVLSDVYVDVREMEGGGRGGGGGGGGWVAPSSFERKTHKFWVGDGALLDVIMATVAEVPLLVYGRSGPLTPRGSAGPAVTPGDGGRACPGPPWGAIATPVNSVYFDSPALRLYRGRLEREEGARLLRARWYGDRVPRGNDVVFLELKTHHESWVCAKSVKRRVSVRERDMGALMELGGGGEEPSAGRTAGWARDVVLGASPNLRGDDLDEAADLLLECRRMVVSHGLRPCVRTRYLRAAFQSPTSNSLRLTVDRSVTLIDEGRAPPGSWRLPDDSTLSVREVSRVPCPILEVKVSGDDLPPFVRQLRDFGSVVDGHKFSKYLTAVAAFHRDDGVGRLPYWAELPMFRGVFFPEDRGEDGDARGAVARSGRIKSGGGGTEPTEEGSGDEEKFENEWSLGGDGEGARGFGHLVGLGLRRRKRGKRPVPYARPVKVEPKSYFANERTFIQWISAALLMVTVAAILMEFGSDGATTTSLVLFILSMVVISYALVVYFRRIHLMRHRKTYGYADFAGPAFLAAAILFGIGAVLYYYFRSPPAAVPRVRPLERDPGLCDLLGLGGSVSAMDYQPSDALADEARGMLLVPSVNLITALPLDPGDVGGAEVVAEIPGADIEALTYVGDTLYALSEQGKRSELFAFQWNENNDSLDETLVMVGRWQIGASGAESITYVADGGAYAGKLIIGSDKGLEVYSVPPPDYGDTSRAGPLLHPARSINRRTACRGLLGDCRTASLQYFEGRLYVLHDNDRVVRVWDVESGRIVSQYSLPWVGGGDDGQWEGMALLRTAPGGGGGGRDGGTNLRRRALPVSSLTLYLALDSPPEVWSIAIAEGEAGLVFPDCAKQAIVQQQAGSQGQGG